MVGGTEISGFQVRLTSSSSVNGPRCDGWVSSFCIIFLAMRTDWMDVQVDNGALFQALSIFIGLKAFIGKLEENVRRIMIILEFLLLNCG